VSSLETRAQVIPGQSLTRSKAVFRRWAVRATGARIWDSEGVEYLDFLCGLGAIGLGYRPAPRSPGVCSLPWDAEVTAAEAVLAHVAPCENWVRFTKTGSEATLAAYRIAKAATGRTEVVRVVGSYHGWHEWCQATPGTLAVGDLPSVEAAAVFVEPPRFGTLDVAWLLSLRRWCDETGTLLLFDSMLYGARWSMGGLSRWSGVRADLECFGKAYGNGQSVAFVVGSARTRAHGEIPSGTYSGDHVGLAAISQTLAAYQAEDALKTIWARGLQLTQGLRVRVPSTLGVVEGEPPIQRIRYHDPAHAAQVTAGMLARGIIWHPDVQLVMAAHTPEDIDQALNALTETLCHLPPA